MCFCLCSHVPLSEYLYRKKASEVSVMKSVCVKSFPERQPVSNECLKEASQAFNQNRAENKMKKKKQSIKQISCVGERQDVVRMKPFDILQCLPKRDYVACAFDGIRT